MTAEIEATVLALWAAALGWDRDEPVPPDVPFSVAGGHSLAAARLVGGIRDRLGVTVALSRLLREDLTAGQLAKAVTALEPAAHTAEASPQGVGAGEVRHTRAALPKSLWPVWAFHRLHPTSPAYNVCRVLTVRGKVSPPALRAALSDISARHEALRSCVVESAPGRPELLVRPAVQPSVGVSLVRAGDATAQLRWDVDAPAPVGAALRAAARRVFDMTAAPMWAVDVVYAPDVDRSWLVLTMHHLISDLRASDVVLGDLAAAYADRLAGATPEQRPAPSLVRRLRADARDPDPERVAHDLAWWRGVLGADVSERPVPLMRAAGDGPEQFDADVDSVAVPAAPVQRLLGELRVTAATVFLTAAAAVSLAWRGYGHAEIAGVPNLRIPEPDEEDLVGFLVDTVPVRCDLPPDAGFADACARVRASFLDALDHGAVTFQDLLDDLRVARSGARTPFIGLWFNDLTHARHPATFGSEPCVEYDLPPIGALFDLGLYLRQVADGFRLHVTTGSGRWAAADRLAFAEQVARLVERAATDPSASLRALLEPAPAPLPAAGPAASAPTGELVAAHAAARPTAVAIGGDGPPVTYADLAARIAAASARFSGDRRVALGARRSVEYVVDLIGAVAADASTVLLDPTWPRERLRQAVEISGATDVVGLPADVVTGLGPPQRDRPGLSIQFTSGSTGSPKAVATTHSVRARCLDDLASLFEIGPQDRVSFLSGPAHDPMWREVELPLRVGGSLWIPPAAVQHEPARLSRWLRDERVTVASASPLLLALAFRLDDSELPELRLVVCGGAPLSGAVARLIRGVAPNATIVNGYGCTETPQLVAARCLAPGEDIDEAATLPIGQPLPGRALLLRATHGGRCDRGHLGRLLVRAPHIAEGYLDDSAARANADQREIASTDPSFVVADDGTRWFDTGDLARVDGAGLLHLAGRADRQCLVNGHRVTLDEIESVARSAPGVDVALAQVVRAGSAESIRLYVQPQPGCEVAEADVRDRLRSMLPPAVVPARVVVTTLRLTPNLKLEAPDGATEGAPSAPSRPDDPPVLRDVRALAEGIVGAPVDPAANFFEVGFTSATMLHFVSELGALLGRDIPAIAAFRYPTLDALLDRLGVVGSPTDGPTAGTRLPTRDAEPAAPDSARARRAALRRQIRERIDNGPAT